MNFLSKILVVSAAVFFLNSISAQTLTPPINSGAILDTADQLIQDNKYDEAIAEYLKIDENDTNYLLGSLQLANTYVLAKKDTAAILLCDKMLEEKNQYEQNFYIIKGSALDDAKRFDEAMKVFNEGLAKYPKNHLIYYNMGLSCFRKKDFSSAEKYFQKAIAINPFHASSHYRLGYSAFSQGKYVPSVLSYMFFLQLENDTKRASELVVYLEKLLKGEFTPEGPLAKGDETDDFSEIESVLKSQVVLNGKYKSKIDLQFDMVKQLQYLFEKLTYNSGDKGFWMQTYVPLFTAIQKEGYFEYMMYSSLKAIENENVDKWLKKHNSQQSDYSSFVLNTLKNYLTTTEENMNGSVQKVEHYFSDYKLRGIGNIKNGISVGYWKYLFTNGFPKSEGLYDSEGKQDGLWRYYFESGGIKEEANFSHGILNGPYNYYYKNGAKSLSANYENDLFTGKVETYYMTTEKKASFDFKAGKKDGTEVTYHPNGAKKSEGKLVNGVIQGEFKEFYPNGQVSEIYNVVDDKQDGPHFSFYENGAKKTEDNYKNNFPTGNYKSFHQNGKLKEEGTYNEKGKHVGLFKDYDVHGRLIEEILYSERGKIISRKNYNTKGKIENELIFKSEELVQSKSYDDAGLTINDQKKKGKNFSVTFYQTNGNKISEGVYIEGERDGEWKFFDDNGIINLIENYKEGKLEGKLTNFFVNGKVKNEVDYKNGLREGLYKANYLNGTLERQGYFQNGNEQGYWYYYNPDGTLSGINYFLNGENVGKSTVFASNGKLDKEEFYKDGYLTKLICYDTTGKKNKTTNFPFGTGDYSLDYINGKSHLTGHYKNGLHEGIFTWYFPNGKIETEATYFNNAKKGKQISFYENLQKNFECSFLNGDLDGSYTTYYENGNIHEQDTYQYGQLHGHQSVFYENKSLYKSYNYSYGKAEGCFRFYSEDGLLIISKFYENDLLKSYAYMNKSGKYDSIPIKNESGKVVSYYSNGQKSVEFEMFDGFYNGKYLEYYSSGKIKKDLIYYYGKQNGIQKYYYANGNLKTEENYLLDQKHGSFKTYHENGKLKQEGFYLNDAKFGNWKTYDNTGKLIKTVKYYDDLQSN